MTQTPNSLTPEIYNSIVDTIGNTPIIRLKRTFAKYPGQWFAKVETFNPGRSSKDRIGVSIIEKAEKEGKLKPGGTIVEATSGNTGLGLALVGIEKGYDVILCIPDKMSPEKINLVKAMGCETIVCPTDVEPDDPQSYYSVSKRIAEETENSFYANQYFNEANPQAHYETTGPEIWKQTGGKITHFIAGVGTGGTISGAGRFLKEKNPDIKVIGVDPEGSILKHYHEHEDTDVEAESYHVEGVGEDIIPSTVHFDVIDEFVKANDQESFEWTRKIAREEGILIGGSAGLAAAGAASYAENNSDESFYAVILFPDTGERYLGKIFSDSWLRSHGFKPAPENIRDILAAKPINIPSLVELKGEATIADGLAKLKKFRINQLIVEIDSEKRILEKNTLYDALMSGIEQSEKLHTLDTEPTHTVPISTNLAELIVDIIVHGIVLISDNDEIIGLLTRQDIIDNIPVKDIPKNNED